MDKTFESWLKELNEYTQSVGYKNCDFEDDEITRDKFESGIGICDAFQDLMGDY